MPSPFDKVTESQQLRNYLENRPVVEELARSQDVVFQAEMNRLGLEEKQKEIAINDENRAIMKSYDENVTSQSSSPEDLMKRTQDFLKKNPRSSAAIMEYAGKASSFFDMGNKSKLSGIQLEQAIRENETQKKFLALNEKSIQANLEASTLKATQDMQTAKIEEYKQNESKLDGISGMFASVSGIGVNSETKKAINVINDSYYRQIDEALSRNDTQGKIDAQRFFDEATKTFGPLLEFDAVNKTLRSAASVKHAETMVKSASIYQPEYKEWVDRKTTEGVDAASVTFDKFLIDCYNEKDEDGSTGNRMMSDNKQAEMLEDFGELAEAKKQFAEYDQALLASIDPVTGLPDRSKMGSLNRESAKMRNLLKQAMDRRKIKADTTTQQLEQEKTRLDILRDQADLRNTESLIKARDEGRIDVTDPELENLQSERSKLITSIRAAELKSATTKGKKTDIEGLVTKLNQDLVALETKITNRQDAITLKSKATNSVTPAE
jgi:hypothetical protein